MNKGAYSKDYQLAKDEKVLWESETVPFSIVEGGEGREVVFLWVLCLLWPVFAIALSAFDNHMSVAVTIMLSLLTVWLSLSPVAIYRQIVRQRYLLTNERAILVKPRGQNYSVPLDRIKGFYTLETTQTREEGALILRTRDCVFDTRQLRERSVHPEMVADDSGNLETNELVFYHANNLSEAVKILDTMVKENSVRGL